MIATLTALLTAHVLADFAFQTGWMAARKREPGILALHGVIVLVLSLAAVGHVFAWPILLLALLHVATDAAKSRIARPGIEPFLIDQAVHLAVVFATAVWAPGLWAHGHWAAAAPDAQLAALQAMALVAGVLLATRAGGFAIDLFMKDRLAPGAEELPEGLPGGGMTIGLLERGLIFLMIIANQAAAIGFLIAAKSVLRFGAASEDRKASEYVIIGTLASFGWAIAASLLTVELLHRLPAALTP